MNELLEAKLTISRIKSEVLNLAAELVADETSDKDYAIKRLVGIVEFIEQYDVKVKDIEL